MPRRVIVFGRVLRQWQPALPMPRLQALAGVPELWRIKRLLRMWLLPGAVRRQSLVLCFTERSMRDCPRDGWMLLPSHAALRILGNKRHFARYATEQGLGDYVPAAYPSPGQAQWPAVLKLDRGTAGSAVAVVQSAAEMEAARRRMPRWRFQAPLLQELLSGPDSVTHAIVRDGRLLWHVTYDYTLRAGDVVQTHENVAAWQPGALGEDEVAVLERFLVPLGYDGPIAVDFKRRADGRLCVLEINPRFGGSLMRPYHTADLEAALAVWIANAKAPMR